MTTSDGLAHTSFEETNGRWAPRTGIYEHVEEATDAEGHPIQSERELRGHDVVEHATSEWTGVYDMDCGVEKHLIQSFFIKLVEAISNATDADEAPHPFLRLVSIRDVASCRVLYTR